MVQTRESHFEKELADFAGNDEAKAGEAFTRLFEASRAELGRYVSYKVRPPVQADDILQDVYVRVWSRRDRFRPMGWPSWKSFIRRAAEWSLASSGPKSPEIPFESIEDLPPEDWLAAAVFLMPSLDREEIGRAADIVLLGVDESVDRRTLTRRLLAAQLFYVDGKEWSEVAAILNSARPYSAPVTREELDNWLTDRSTLLKLFYESLYLTPEELAADLLGQDQNSWTPSEKHWILLRYQSTMPIENIVRHEAGRVSEEELSRFFDRCVENFPFVGRMRTLMDRVGRHTANLNLAKPGLWQRLAFEYWMFNELQQADIVQRTNPAAKAAGGSVNAGQLNVWLSNGRILKRVARHLNLGQEE